VTFLRPPDWQDCCDSSVSSGPIAASSAVATDSDVADLIIADDFHFGSQLS